jgi:GH25 family lysozyme M1 (1,4-beta-N-acetylmuramidase)
MGVLGRCGWIALIAATWAGAAAADVVSAMVDISSYQNVDTVIPLAKAAGVELLIHRASLSADRTDTAFQAAFRKIRSAKLSVGAYHVLYAQAGPDDLAHAGMSQAHQFLGAVAAACKKGEPVLLALDWEAPGGAAPASAQTAAEFVSEVRSQTGAEVLVYSDAHTLGLSRSGIGQVLSGSPLWFAGYHRSLRFETDPRTVKYAASDDAIDITIQRRRVDGLTFPIGDDIAPWKAATFWQFSEGGDNGAGPAWDPVRQIEPQITAFDTSYFFGAREDFRKFVTATSWKCDPKIAKAWANLPPPVPPPIPTPPAGLLPAFPPPAAAAPTLTPGQPPTPVPAPTPAPRASGV